MVNKSGRILFNDPGGLILGTPTGTVFHTLLLGKDYFRENLSFPMDHDIATTINNNVSIIYRI